MQYTASTINRTALPRSKRMRALGAASVTPTVVNGESGDKYWNGEIDTETEETEVSTTYPIKISKRLRIVDESGTLHGNISIDANGRFVFDKGIISKEDIIAYGVGGEDVKSVTDVIEEYLSEHGGGGGGLSSVVITSSGSGNVVSGMSKTLSDDGKTLTLTLTKEISAYVKPSTGIPLADLASSVQTALEKADTAIQSLSGYATESWVTKNYAPKGHYHFTLLDSSDELHSVGLAYYATARTSSNTTYLGAWFCIGEDKGYSVGKIGKDDIKAWLGLGARAYDSTSYLPLSGGHITGTCSIDKTKWLVMHGSDYSDGMPNHGIGWDNNTQGNHCLYLRNYFGINLWSNPTHGGPISVNSNLYVSGNVGIGTSPSYKLHVAGNIYGTGWIQSLGGIYAGIQKGAGGVVYVDGCKKLSAHPTYNNATYLYGDSIVILNNAENSTLFKLHASQNGLGHNCCNRPIQFNKGLKARCICLECDNDGVSGSKDGEINNYTGGLGIQHTSTQNLFLCVGGGNVGIGTTSPSHKLHVEGGNVKVSSSNSGAGGDVYVDLWRGANFSWRILNSGGIFHLQTNGNQNGSTLNSGFRSIFSCSYNDNVGIGTSSPSEKLHVNGKVYTSDMLSVGANIARGNVNRAELTCVSATNVPSDIILGSNSAKKWSLTCRDSGDSHLFALWSCVNSLYAMRIDHNGNLITNGDQGAFSDARLKSDIKDLEYRGPLEPKTYIKDGKKCIGFIAQEVRELYPELVLGEEKEDEYLSLNYGAITAVLSAENRELKKEVDELKGEVEELKKMVKLLMERR